jgi:uncharacterized protein YodC (DUF2158 family)
MEAKSSLKSGDLVKLRSGGPLMTVNGFTNSQVICVYFDEKNEFKSIQVFSGALKAVSEDE